MNLLIYKSFWILRDFQNSFNVLGVREKIMKR